MVQFMAIAIFLIMFFLIITEKLERHITTLLCGLLTLIVVFGIGMHDLYAIWTTLNLGCFFQLDFWFSSAETSSISAGINWQTITFIAGMMIMVEGMSYSGFFRWLCMRIAKLVHYKITSIFIAFMLISGLLSMFIDSITVILFLAAVTVELSQLLKFNPVPMILSEIFCANLGGASTMCGDPPNIIIGTSLGYSFADFIQNTGIMAGLALILAIIYFYFIFRKQLVCQEVVDTATFPDSKEAISDNLHFILSCIIFFCAIALLITHSYTGLSVATIGINIAVVTLIVAGKNAVALLKRIDYKTLLFFIGLFIVVGGLQQTGVLDVLASIIGKISAGNMATMVVIIIWGSAIASAFIDNIPFAATMIPVIQSLSMTQGVDLSILAWALSMGTDIGGSATPIGASANVVGTAVAGKAGYPVSWKIYCKSMSPVTILVVFLSMLFIFLRYLY